MMKNLKGDWMVHLLDENGNEICGGALKWLSDNSVISLWADDKNIMMKMEIALGVWKEWF